MRMSRIWAMPTADTFDCAPIGDLVRRYLTGVSIDPFSRNKRWATHTNDLNPNTAAEFHMDATEFLEKLANDGVRADVVVIDPPYSPRQVKECYDGIGVKMGQKDALLGFTRKQMRQQINRLLPLGGRTLWFGWNSVGMGAGYEIEEILLVCHGSDHNDTICTVERRISEQLSIIDQPGQGVLPARVSTPSHAAPALFLSSDVVESPHSDTAACQ